MHAKSIQLIATGLIYMFLFSCQLPREHVTGSSSQLRQRARGKRAHAAGLRTDIKDLDHTIEASRESMKQLRRRMGELDSRIQELKTEVQKLEAEQAGRPPREAHKMRITVRRWQNRLGTIQAQRDTLAGHVRAIEHQIQEHKSVQKAHIINAEKMEAHASELERLAQEREGKEPEPEPTFWSLW